MPRKWDRLLGPLRDYPSPAFALFSDDNAVP